MEKKEIPIVPFYLIPQWQAEKLESSSANFSLSFSKMNLWKESKKNKSFEIFNKLDSWEDETLKIKYVEVADSKAIFNNEHLCRLCNRQLKDKQSFLDKIINTQKEYIDFMNGSEIKAKLVSPFITGLGSGHPTETGMILDRNTGVPYIPASSIKGVLRTAYAVVNAREIKETHKNSEGKIVEYDCMGVPDDELNEIFGGENSSSKVIFLDAYPEKIPTIQSDIMNPHFSKYYNGENKVPLENEEPRPIKFLSVKPGCNFVFRYIIKNNSISEDEVENWFQTAFEKIGFGGKTAIGYGRFKTEENSVEKTLETKDVGLDINELVSKLKPETVKKDKQKAVEAYISSANGKSITAKINIKWGNNTNPQIFEISVSGMSSAEVGRKVKLLLNNFSKDGPTNGKITN